MNRPSRAAPREISGDPLEICVDETGSGQRLDAFLAQCFGAYSRTHLRRVINAGGVMVNGAPTKAALRLGAGDRITIELPDIPRRCVQPEDIPLDILYQDDALAVVDKPPGMVVHPGKGNWSGTLVAALAHHLGKLSSVGGPERPGVVHRLDRDTSGVIVVARTDRVHTALAAQFEARTVEKEYFALTAGAPDRDRDVIEQPIGMHPYHREKMAIRAEHSTSRDAATFYEAVERFDGFAAMRVLPKTGRTHQIRVHLAHIGCPVLCDRQYGGRAEIALGEIRSSGEERVILNRQALHARRLKLQHPISGELVEFVAPLPEDMSAALDELRQWRRL